MMMAQQNMQTCLKNRNFIRCWGLPGIKNLHTVRKPRRGHDIGEASDRWLLQTSLSDG